MKISKLLATISWLCFFVALLLSDVFTVAFQQSFYETEYAKYSQAEVIGMNDRDLMKSTNVLLDYIKDNRDDIIVEATINGNQREVFDEREKLHMVDVKNLYANASTARYVLLAIGVFGLFVTILKNRKGWISLLRETYFKSLLIFGLFVGILAVWIMADFNSFWLDFHYLFFDNDLFFLDPNTSIMINMFPENFFFDLVFKIVLIFIVILGCLGILLQSIYMIRKRKLLHD